VRAGPTLLLALGASWPAGAQFYEPYDGFPLPPPLALPQQVNGMIRGSSAPEETGRIDRIADVFSAMRACWRPPAFLEGPTGLQITVRTSFNRSGQAIGRPQITYFRSGGGREARDRFAASIADAFSRCSRLPFTDGFGSAVAGRPFTFRFIDDRQS
jgi:hypothetical protein